MNKTLKLKAHGKAFGKIAEYQLLSEAYLSPRQILFICWEFHPTNQSHGIFFAQIWNQRIELSLFK